MQRARRPLPTRWLFGLALLAACQGIGALAWSDPLLKSSGFTNANGAFPVAGVVVDRGVVYGTTSAGANGSGTVFEWRHGHRPKTLYAFCSQSGCSDGDGPRGDLIRDGAGNLYGTTVGGGANGGGTVFEVNPGGGEATLYSFCGVVTNSFCADGNGPVAGLVMDAAGNLYGTTQLGGDNDLGTVFELRLNPKKGIWTHQVLYSFCPGGSGTGCPDGQGPLAGVILDGAGNLYGTTQLGGANGQGTVFEVTPGVGEQVLYNFCSAQGCADGAEPWAGLVMDPSGNLFGTTKYGGNPACGNGGGTVFELSGSQQSVLYAFCSQPGDADGSYPEAGLLLDASGNLYGTTTTGGIATGVVFELSGGSETVLYSFCNATGCPANPVADLAMDAAGSLYGTTSLGGADDFGTVFKLKH